MYNWKSPQAQASLAKKGARVMGIRKTSGALKLSARAGAFNDILTHIGLRTPPPRTHHVRNALGLGALGATGLAGVGLAGNYGYESLQQLVGEEWNNFMSNLGKAIDEAPGNYGKLRALGSAGEGVSPGATDPPHMHISPEHWERYKGKSP